MKIGIIGSGKVGTALARLATAAGHEVRVGTREVGDRSHDDGLHRVRVQEAVASDLIVLALPFAACAQALPPLESLLSGKIVVDATNPLAEDWSPLALGEGNSAGAEIARLLPASRVVKAFNTVFADIMTPHGLLRDGHSRTTAFIASDDEPAAREVAAFAESLGFAAQLAGRLSHAVHLEAIAHLNIAIALAGGGTDAAFVYHRAKG